jgi:hypothetical protein
MSDEAWNLALKIAATLGPGGSAMLLVVLYFVNKERVEKDKMLMQMTVTGIKAMNAATNAINSLRGEVKAMRRRPRTGGR